MRRACLALLLTGAHLLAQTGESRVRVKFRALSFEGPILGAAYLDGNDVRPLDLSADCFTAEQTYVGPNPLRLVLRDDAVPAAAPPVVRPGAARMAALAQELETVQRRLATLTADAREREQFIAKLRACAGGNPAATRVDTFLFQAKLPVDVRHNAKIHRLQLAKEWSARLAR